MTPDACRAHDVLLRERRGYFEAKARYLLAAMELRRQLERAKQPKEQKR